MKLSVSHGKKATQGCRCGFYGDTARECICTPSAVSRYKKRISGPLLDRVDLFVDVPRIEYEKLVAPTSAETSSGIRRRTEAAREIQRTRFDGTGLITNAEMGPVEVWNYCPVEDAAKALLQAAMKQMHLSARGFHRVLKLARTIADLAQAEDIGVAHLAEGAPVPRDPAGVDRLNIYFSRHARRKMRRHGISEDVVTVSPRPRLRGTHEDRIRQGSRCAVHRLDAVPLGDQTGSGEGLLRIDLGSRSRRSATGRKARAQGEGPSSCRHVHPDSSSTT